MSSADPSRTERELIARIEALEVRLAHQEYPQDEQARVQHALQQDNQELRRQLQWLRDRLRELEDQGGSPGADNEPPPPHY